MKQSVSERKTHIGRAEKISVKKQCELLHVSRSSHYYEKVPESDFNLKLMEMIDREFMEHPWKGVPRMVQWLSKDCGLLVNKKTCGAALPADGHQRICSRAQHEQKW